MRKFFLPNTLRDPRRPVVYAAARPDRRGDPETGTIIML
jgi:hypothetical protein